MRVCEQKNGGNEYKSYRIRNHAEHHHYRKREQNEVERETCLRESRGLAVVHKRSFRDGKAAERDENHGKEERREHDSHEFHIRDIEERIEIQVLRIAERGQHTTEICGDVLENEHIRHVFLIVRSLKHDTAEGKKRYQSHIVCDEHGADKRYVHKCDDRIAKIVRQSDYAFGGNGEEIDTSQGADYRKGTEKAGEGSRVYVGKIFAVGRHDNRGYGGGCKRDNEHGIFPNKRCNLRNDGSEYVVRGLAVC